MRYDATRAGGGPAVELMAIPFLEALLGMADAAFGILFGFPDCEVPHACVDPQPPGRCLFLHGGELEL